MTDQEMKDAILKFVHSVPDEICYVHVITSGQTRLKHFQWKRDLGWKDEWYEENNNTRGGDDSV